MNRQRPTYTRPHAPCRSGPAKDTCNWECCLKWRRDTLSTARISTYYVYRRQNSGTSFNVPSLFAIQQSLVRSTFHGIYETVLSTIDPLVDFLVAYGELVAAVALARIARIRPTTRTEIEPSKAIGSKPVEIMDRPSWGVWGLGKPRTRHCLNLAQPDPERDQVHFRTVLQMSLYTDI